MAKLTDPDAPRVLAVSARDPQAAVQACVRLAERLERSPGLDPDDVAATLAHGRERFAVRHAVVGADSGQLARALRRSALTPRPLPGAGADLVIDLGDGSGLRGTPDLPQVAEAIAYAGDLDFPAGADRLAAGEAAVLHGTVQWLASLGVRPVTVRGRGTAAPVAAALRGELPLREALLAAATETPAPAAPSVAADAVVLHLGAGPEEALVLDPLSPASVAHAFAALWEHGADVDASLGREGRRVRLPGYPFQRGRAVDEPAHGLRPLTAHEQRWLFHDLVRSGSAAEHTLAATASFRGPVPTAAEADAALAALLELHPRLRTRFTRHAGRWFARDAVEALAVTVVPDAPGSPAGERVRAAVVGASFAGEDLPLVRCALSPAGDGWAAALALYAPVAGDAAPQELLASWAALARDAHADGAAPAALATL
ncbi:hypothetical protein ABT160_28865 [Streptomyces sp. NPDC001941]|uniref:CurL C-terminal domain-containing protein n=1 Tax=Streptomyces sp. NPDC001941 TaxID=3154659 RepID=UPI00331F9A28